MSESKELISQRLRRQDAGADDCMDAGGRATQDAKADDCMDAGGRATQDAKAERLGKA